MKPFKLPFLLLPFASGKKFRNASIGIAVGVTREERIPSFVSRGERQMTGTKSKTATNADPQNPSVEARAYLRHRHLKQENTQWEPTQKPNLQIVPKNCSFAAAEMEYSTIRQLGDGSQNVHNHSSTNTNLFKHDERKRLRPNKISPVVSAGGVSAKTKRAKRSKSPSSQPTNNVCPEWVTVVNNADLIPDVNGSDGKFFASYNAPSLNTHGFVVFRARSTGGGDPSTGIFVRDMYGEDKGIVRQAGRRTNVTEPNNLGADFIEFPSFPRISTQAYRIATRGNHAPVCQYALGGEYNCDDAIPDKDVDSTKVGTTGLFANLDPREDDNDTTDTSENLFTAMAKLGSVPYPKDKYYKLFQVPGLENETGVAFDVFPGSPAIDDEGYIGSKGNYLKLGLGQTGVFYRKLTKEPLGANLGTLHVIANSETQIPDPIQGPRTKICYADTFGSTAPPSVAKGKMVFLGLDNEDSPKCGGIYEAQMTGDKPDLTPLVDLKTEVPGEKGELFSHIGEVLSYDGSAVSFWGAWGDETRPIKLCCPSSGNKNRMNFCLNIEDYDPITGNMTGDTNTILNKTSEAPDDCASKKYQVKTVPINQGFFVYNKVDKKNRSKANKKGKKNRSKAGKTIKSIAKIASSETNDMLFWTYSGKPPAAGPGDTGHTGHRKLDGDSDDAEPPRWRSSATAALSRHNHVIYKQMINGTVGIWHWNGDVSDAIVKTGDNCTDLDVDGIGFIESLAIERDGFRGPWLAIAAACAEEVVDDELVEEKDSDNGDSDDGDSDDGDSDDGDWGGIYLKGLCFTKDE